MQLLGVKVYDTKRLILAPEVTGPRDLWQIQLALLPLKTEPRKCLHWLACVSSSDEGDVLKPTCLIFDVDGTLAETEEIHRRAFNETFQQVGLSWYWSQDLYRSLLEITGGKERIAHYQGSFSSERQLTTDQIAEVHATKTHRYNELISSGEITLRPGIERLIREAVEHSVTLAIATTTSKANVKSLLEATLGLGSVDLFATIAAGDMAAKKKPAPDVYHLVLEALALQAKDCIAFEDSANGLASARQAGIPTVVTVSYYTRGQTFEGAESVLDHLGDPEERATVYSGRSLSGNMVDLAWLTGKAFTA